MHKWLLPDPDQDDLLRHVDRCDPELLTKRCYENIPVIGFVGGRVLAAGVWGAEGEIPLLEGPMNQNAIQLASNHYLLADWIVAVAAMAVIPGVTVVGIHDPDQSAPIQVWTTKAEIQHLAAGTGTITTAWRPELAEIARLRKDLVANGQATFATTVDIVQDDRVVSRVSLTQLMLVVNPRAVGESTTMIQAHSHKVSALMVAGLRLDEVSQEIAGEQGRALAARMSRNLPELATMVQARTKHLDDLITAGPNIFRQILIVGIGLDTRPQRLATSAVWYGVDLEPGIKNRARLFAKLQTNTGKADPVQLVAADIREAHWLAALCERGFDPALPTLIVVEGVSMYLTPVEIEDLLERLAAAAQCATSRLWIDHLAPSVLDSPLVAVQQFLTTMARMGEPFESAFDNLEQSARKHWRTHSMLNAAEVSGLHDDLHEGYRFSVLAPAV